MILASNLRFFVQFPRNKSLMQVWVPEGNQMSINEVQSSNLWDRTYWDAYFEEQDLEVRESMLAGFDSPNFKMQDRRLSDLDYAWEPFENS